MNLVRKGRDVFHNEVKLTRVDQASKGPGNEVIKIEGLDGANGAKWISLSKLVEGSNEIQVQGKVITSTGSYTLTPQEKEEVDKLQARINQIKDAARSRYVSKPKFIDPSKMTEEERELAIQQMEKYLGVLRG